MSNLLSVETLSIDKVITRTDRNTVQKGISYFSQGRARIVSRNSQSAVLHVMGSQRYEVDIWMEGGQAQMVCDCPMSDGDPSVTCKHQSTAGLALCHRARGISITRSLIPSLL